ncbi:MAG: cell wall hydrolase [Bacillota bacterium]
MIRRWKWVFVWIGLLALSVSITQYIEGQRFARSLENVEAIPVQGGWGAVSSADDITLLARIIAGEARGENYIGQVAVGAVVLNRVKSPSFPNTIAGVIYQPLAFSSVAEGQIYLPVPTLSRKAAYDALNGWDPTFGSLFFWNPSKPVSRWIWTRRILITIGRHVFGK